jgi:anti-anti-sigma factor
VRTRAGAAAGRPLDTVELATVATRANLAALMARADRAAARAGLDADRAGELRLAVEEACRNVIEHGYPPGRPGPIRLSIAVHADRVVVTVVDAAPTFDPADAPEPDLTADWRQRRIGGLGWHLIRRVMDSVVHDVPPGGGNRLTLVKFVQPPNQLAREGPSMEIEIRSIEHVTVVAISGSVDSLTADTLADAFSTQLKQDRVRLVADLSQVLYTSSAGLRTLLSTMKDARRRGGDFRLASVQPPVLRVLELSGFTGILNLFPDVDAAVASFPAGHA